ncbi:SRPBCC domain-containing protein [Acidicapsa dinghuensis]|uniref:SRPBCC domain-containing protein n=1 Tax=Acidicapsa dinghuensis TaxID=2218256 RepID=A0ABW1EKJ9_9BACT|nr:SRPBCC domain-containing protein [Acidicapsa dinghuensis]
MEQLPVVHSTFVLERSFAAPLDRVFSAFSDPAKKRIWLSEDGDHPVDSFEMDFHLGGIERLEYKLGDDTPFPGTPLVSLSIFQNIVDGARIVQASRMTLGGHCISATLVTFEFSASDEGTGLTVTHQGAFFERSDGPQMREGGWCRLMDSLGNYLHSE